ncbi:GntR family transcriptional regulator [Deinococcus sp.]|uniref:GntR family transcriptional regulator n=1 Tax=Deinococcus sp. TaxID=47478 RepID=UPI00286994E9|nr:GntR family transcriptional regulator [Deinococcus sp.]
MTRAEALLDTLKASLDPAGPLPPYAQLRVAFALAIERALLRPGDSLPTVRALAADLGLAVNTVAKTYTALRQDGLTENRAGAGTTVAASAWAGGLHQREALEGWRRHSRDLLAAGIGAETLKAALDELLVGGSVSALEQKGQDSGL